MAKRAEPPQVLRHVYQRQTPRYTPRRPERTLLYQLRRSSFNIASEGAST